MYSLNICISLYNRQAMCHDRMLYQIISIYMYVCILIISYVIQDLHSVSDFRRLYRFLMFYRGILFDYVCMVGDFKPRI